MNTTNGSAEVDAVIAGGGMVGLALAAKLGQSGFNVVVIEKNDRAFESPSAGHFSPRVSAINIASERLLTEIGAWELIPWQRKSLYDQMSVWDGLGSAQIHFDTLSVKHNHLGHIIENHLIVGALWQVIDQLPNVETINGDSIEQWQQDVNLVHIQTTQGITLTAELLIGCEGKMSAVREQSNIHSWSWDYQHTAIVTTVTHEQHHKHTAQQVFLESGPLAFLPLSDEENTGQQSSIVWSVKRERADELIAMTDEDFCSALEQAFENRLGKVAAIAQRAHFPLTAQQAKTYFDQRVVVLGDAAHSIHPLAGLGVNTGFLDAATLAEELTSAQQKGTPIAHPFVLRRFQRRRQIHNLATAGLMETLKRLYDTQATLPVLTRNLGLTLVNNHNMAKRPLVLAAMGELGQL